MRHGPQHPRTPDQKGHPAADAHLREEVPGTARHLPDRRGPRRGGQFRHAVALSRHHRHRHQGEEHRLGHRPGDRRRRVSALRCGPVALRASHLGGHRRRLDLRPTHQGLHPYPRDAGRLLLANTDRRPHQSFEQRRDRRATGLHRPLLERGGQRHLGDDRDRHDAGPELADHAGRAAAVAGLPDPGATGWGENWERCSSAAWN